MKKKRLERPLSSAHLFITMCMLTNACRIAGRWRSSNLLSLLSQKEAPTNVARSQVTPGAKTGFHLGCVVFRNANLALLFEQHFTDTSIVRRDVGRMLFKVKSSETGLDEGRLVVGDCPKLAEMDAVVNGLHFRRIDLFSLHNVGEDHPAARTQDTSRFLDSSTLTIGTYMEEGIHAHHKIGTLVGHAHVKIGLFKNANVTIATNLGIQATGLGAHFAAYVSADGRPHHTALPETTQEATKAASKVADANLAIVTKLVADARHKFNFMKILGLGDLLNLGEGLFVVARQKVVATNVRR